MDAVAVAMDSAAAVAEARGLRAEVRAVAASRPAARMVEVSKVAPNKLAVRVANKVNTVRTAKAEAAVDVVVAGVAVVAADANGVYGSS